MKKLLNAIIVMATLLFIMAPLVPVVFGPEHDCLQQECLRIFVPELGKMGTFGMCIYKALAWYCSFFGVAGVIAMFAALSHIEKTIVPAVAISATLNATTCAAAFIHPAYWKAALIQAVISLLGLALVWAIHKKRWFSPDGNRKS